MHRGGLGAIDRALDAATASAQAPPVLIGHSLGGLAALRTARRHPLAALIPLVPAPPDGLAFAFLRQALRDPMSAAKLIGLGVSAAPVRAFPLRPPRGVYSERVSAVVQAAGNRLRVSESWLVLVSLAIGSREPVAPNSDAHAGGRRRIGHARPTRTRRATRLGTRGRASDARSRTRLQRRTGRTRAGRGHGRDMARDFGIVERAQSEVVTDRGRVLTSSGRPHKSNEVSE